jgi:hypothetical protein
MYNESPAAIPFVELNGDFALLRKDQPVAFDLGRAWGRKLGEHKDSNFPGASKTSEAAAFLARRR